MPAVDLLNGQQDAQFSYSNLCMIIRKDTSLCDALFELRT